MTRAATTTYTLLLAVVLAAAVFVNGARAQNQWLPCAAAIAVIALVYYAHSYVGSGFPGLSSVEASRADWTPTWLVFAAPAYVAFQLLPLPLPVLRVLSPRRAEIADALGAVMPRPWASPLSIEPASTAAMLLTVIACTLCFLIVREVTWLSLRRASWLTIAPLMVIGVFEGGFALWQSLNGIEVAGTYWNRNHLAGLLEMVLPLSVAYVLYARRKGLNDRPEGTAREMVWSVMGAAVPMLAAAVIFAGVLASVSKMGYVATLFGLMTMGLVAAQARLSGMTKWACIVGVPVLALIAFAQFGNQDVLIRITSALDTEKGMTGEGRVPIWMDSLRLLAAHPVFGSGLGTYFTAFLPYQTTTLNLLWTHAHNDYVEFATDLGVAGFALFGALMAIVVSRAIGLTRAVRRSGSDLVALGSVGAFAAIGIHSLADFNLQLPGNALLLAWIAGVAAGIPPKSAGSKDPASDKLYGGRVFRPGNFAVVLACVALAMASTRMLARNLPDQPNLEQHLDALRKSPASPYAWLDAAEAFVQAGRSAEAKASTSRAMALGPRDPVVTKRSATLFDAVGDRRQAVTLMARALHETGTEPAEVFDWFVEHRIPSADVLAGLSNDTRVLPAYLRYLMLPGTCNEAGQAWQALLVHRPEPKLAGDYVNFVRDNCSQPDDAVRAWIQYAKLAMPGYQVSDWVFNGDFELDSAPVQFDWRWNERSSARDNTEKFSGSRSLRIVLRGPSRLAYEGASQTVAVTPGTYRFSAAVRTLGLESADGIAFLISGRGKGSRLETHTEQTTGTTTWHTISADVVIPDGATEIRIQIVRRPGPGAEKEEDLNATVWVDAITLTRVG